MLGWPGRWGLVCTCMCVSYVHVHFSSGTSTCTCTRNNGDQGCALIRTIPSRWLHLTLCISYLHCRWYSYVGSTLCHGETPGSNCTFQPWLSAMRKWISITMQRSVFRQCTFLLSHLPVVRHCTCVCIDSLRHLKIIHFQYPISLLVNIQSLIGPHNNNNTPPREGGGFPRGTP